LFADHSVLLIPYRFNLWGILFLLVIFVFQQTIFTMYDFLKRFVIKKHKEYWCIFDTHEERQISNDYTEYDHVMVAYAFIRDMHSRGYIIGNY